jgi:hypothetical protein
MTANLSLSRLLVRMNFRVFVWLALRWAWDAVAHVLPYRW